MIHINARLTGFSAIDFDRRAIRKVLTPLAKDLQKDARRLISRRAVSGAGENPGRDSGALLRSIRYKIGRSGLYAVLAPQRTAALMRKNVYYPGPLVFGANRGARGGRLEPRGNFIVEAAQGKEAVIKSRLEAELPFALVPRRYR